MRLVGVLVGVLLEEEEDAGVRDVPVNEVREAAGLLARERRKLLKRGCDGFLLAGLRCPACDHDERHDGSPSPDHSTDERRAKVRTSACVPFCPRPSAWSAT